MLYFCIYAFDCKKLIYGYSSVNPLFRNLNLSVEKGRIIALAGESGCGKNLPLLNIIYGLIDWQSGKFFLEDEKLMVQKETLFPRKRFKIGFSAL